MQTLIKPKKFSFATDIIAFTLCLDIGNRIMSRLGVIHSKVSYKLDTIPFEVQVTIFTCIFMKSTVSMFLRF